MLKLFRHKWLILLVLVPLLASLVGAAKISQAARPVHLSFQTVPGILRVADDEVPGIVLQETRVLADTVRTSEANETQVEETAEANETHEVENEANEVEDEATEVAEDPDEEVGEVEETVTAVPTVVQTVVPPLVGTPTSVATNTPSASNTPTVSNTSVPVSTPTSAVVLSDQPITPVATSTRTTPPTATATVRPTNTPVPTARATNTAVNVPGGGVHTPTPTPLTPTPVRGNGGGSVPTPTSTPVVVHVPHPPQTGFHYHTTNMVVPAVYARLTINGLGLRNVPVYPAGYDQGTNYPHIVPAVGVTWFNRSAQLGRPGTSLLYAHDDIFGSLFQHLNNMRVGQIVTVHHGIATLHYKVQSVSIVTPNNTSLLNQRRNRSTLVLVTCYPTWVDNMRVVVVATLV